MPCSSTHELEFKARFTEMIVQAGQIQKNLVSSDTYRYFDSEMKKTLFSICVAIGLLGSSLGRAEVTWDELQSNRSLWPDQVTLKQDIEMPVIVNGAVTGQMKLLAGHRVTLEEVTESGVRIRVAGSSKEVTRDQTDALDRAAVLAAQAHETAAQQAAALPLASPTPAGEASANDEAPPKPSLSIPKPQHAMASDYEGRLVRLSGRRVRPDTETELASKEYLVIYYSAGWCGPCHRFTPELVKWYTRNQSKKDKFEIIFVSSDKSDKDFEAYMAEYRMPWPALDFQSASTNRPKRLSRGSGIPCLLVIDRHGNVLADSYDADKTYRGASAVLNDLNKLLAN